jgi:hypothetical protein
MGNKKKTSGVLTMKTEQIKAEFERNFTIELFGNRNIIRRDSEGVWAWIESQLQQAEKRGRVEGFEKGKWDSMWRVSLNLPLIDPNGTKEKSIGKLMSDIKNLNVNEHEDGWQTYKKYHPEISQLTKGE